MDRMTRISSHGHGKEAIGMALLAMVGPALAACPAPGSGIVASGIGITESGCAITTSASGIPGAGTNASNGGTIDLSNSSETLTSAAAALAQNANSKITLTNVTVNTGGGAGLSAGTGSRIEMRGGSLTTTGGITASVAASGAGSTIAMDGVTITSGGSSASALLAGTNSAVSVANSTVNVTSTSSSSANGAYANGSGAQITIDNTDFTVNGGTSGQGVRAFGGGGLIVRNGSSVSTQGNYVYGALIDQNSSLQIADTSLSTTGNFAFGIYTQNQSTLNGSNVILNTQGQNGYGWFAIGSAPQAQLNDSSIATRGPNAHGVFAYNGAVLGLNNTDITTNGSGAAAVLTLNGSRVTIANGELATHGAGAAGLQAEGNAGQTNRFDVTDTRIATDSGAAIEVYGGIATINLTRVNSTSGSNQLMLVDTTAGLAASDPDVTLPATNLATVTLIADSSTLSGDIHADPGSSVNVTLRNHTTLTGAIDPVDLTIDSSSVWNMTGNSVLNNLSNAGGIVSVPNGNSYKTLTVGNLASNGGAITLNAALGPDNSPADRIVVDGGTTTGQTALAVRNTVGQGAQTTGNGIQVVEALNGGTTATAAFDLNERAVAGPYEYFLYRGAVDGTNPDAWYLRSDLEPSPPSPAPTPPDYRPETSLYGAIPALTLVYSRAVVDTLHERGGEQRALPGAKPPAQDRSEFGADAGWGRVIYRNGEQERGHDAAFGQTPAYDFELYAVQGGVDLYRADYSDGTIDRAGLSLDAGHLQGGVEHYNGRDAGDDTLRAYGIGGYWTRFGPAGWYLDGLVQVHRFDITARPHNLPHLVTDGWGVSASLEAGYPFAIGNARVVEPQLQFVYSRANLDDSHDIGARVRFRDEQSLIARLGVRVAQDWLRTVDHGETRRTDGWLRFSVWNDFKGEPKTEFSSEYGYVPFKADIGGSWGEFNIGVDWQLDRRATLYVSAGYQQSFDGDSHSYEGMVGIKAPFD